MFPATLLQKQKVKLYIIIISIKYFLCGGTMKKYKIFLADANSTFVNNLEHRLRSNSDIEFIRSNHLMFHLNQYINDINQDIISFDMLVPKNKTKDKDFSIEVNISNRLSKLGMPSGLSGYRYMISAIKLVLSNENALDSVTKILYPDIAKNTSRLHNVSKKRSDTRLKLPGVIIY